VILPETDLAWAKAVAERIRHRIESLEIPHALSTASNHITVSLGVVTVTSTAVDTVEATVKLADQQLYQAKVMGRNRVMAQGVFGMAQGAFSPD
jgi:diguanylate cyclase (GGDEF)-like protein